MRRIAFWLWLPSSLAVLSIVAANPADVAAQDAARKSELTALVRQDCGSCHGIAHLEAEGIAQIILDGIPGKPMPPWRGLVSEAEARWIAERLKEGFPQ